MNILKKLMMVVVFSFVQVYTLPALASLGYMRISLIENELQIKTQETGDWEYAAINTPLDVGDELWVPQGGRAELQLNSGTYVRLDGNTAIQILSLDNDSSQFYLSQGNAYVYYDAPRGSVIQVDTPDVAARSFSRAIFNLGIATQYTDVAVYKGYVVTENRVGEIRVNAGNRVYLAAETNGEIAPLGYLDDWERWNQARDELLYRARESQSVRYLPSELRTYYTDFDSYGSWVHVRDYGHVWRPQAYIDVGWSPYRHGRWIWRGGHYIWVGYEPWGWAPYHYGRWAFVGDFGWCWVPPLPGSVYWGPGYVGWIRTVDYVGWVPLAPDEVYYGYGYYGRNSVNLVNVDIDEIHFTNVYQNINVNNGPIVVNRNTFRGGGHENVLVDNDIRGRVFTKNNMIPGPPDIKPEKKRLFAVEKEIPKDRMPPRQIQMKPAKEMKELRRLTREEGRSVFRPETGPANLPVTKGGAELAEGKRKPKLEKIQPMKREQLERPLPAGPETIPEGKRDKGRVVPEEQRKSMGPPDRGDGMKKRGEQPPPVQREQLERPLPPRPRDVPEAKREKGKPPRQVEQEPRMAPAQPVKPEGSRELRREPSAPQPQRPAAQPPPVRQKLPAPQVQPVEPERFRPPAPEKKQVQPAQRNPQPQPVPPPPPVSGEGRKTKEKGQQAQPAAPQCGPGQPDQFDPAKCPQNFQKMNNPGKPGR